MALFDGSPVSYAARLEEALNLRHAPQRFAVVNRGMPAEGVTIGGVQRIASVLASDRPQVLLLLEGINDIAEEIPVPQVAAALQTIVNRSLQSGAPVFLATMFQTYEVTRPDGTFHTNGAEFVPALNQRIRQIATQQNVYLVDLEAAFGTNQSLVGGDGLHPTEAGYALMATTFRTAIERALPGSGIVPVMGQPDEPRDRISAYLAGQGLTDRALQIVALTGDASDRRYYRVLLSGGESLVLALHAGPIEFEAMPFVAVARLMSELPLPVPRILHHSDPLGIIGLQDLGDVTLQAHLGAATPDEHAELYRQAVSFIARLQQRGAEIASDDYVPYRIAFDTDKLTWELEFFLKHFLMAYRGAEPSPAVREALAEEWSIIVEELASEPRVLCHRDYHSRNLMLRDGALYIIDFQDARMGPDTYDLASLLRDSYVDLAAQQLESLIAYFLALKHGAAGVGPEEAAEFRRRFDLMALQRNLKALGTFGYQTVTRDNTVYIQYIPRTLAHVRANLKKYPRFARSAGAAGEPSRRDEVTARLRSPEPFELRRGGPARMRVWP